MKGYYGAHCHICQHIEHRDDPGEWWGTPPTGLQCRGCGFCQEAAFARFVEAHVTRDMFSPEVRAAVRAFRDGRDHPLIDRLRDELQAEGGVL